MQKQKYAGVVPYSVVKGHVVCFLWQHEVTDRDSPANAEKIGEMICYLDEDRNEHFFEACARCISNRTGGALGGRKKEKNVKKAEKRLLKRLRSYEGVYRLRGSNHGIYWVPVQYVKPKNLVDGYQHGRGHWVLFEHLLEKLSDVNPETWVVSTVSKIEATIEMQFGSCLRVPQTLNDLKETFQSVELEVEVPEMAKAEALETKVDLTNRKVDFLCRKCRQLLFYDVQLKDHGTEKTCSGYFLDEPFVLLNHLGDFSQVVGKLSCPKCNAKLGHFNLTGVLCKCHDWVSPAVIVPFSKVDRRPIQRKFNPQFPSFGPLSGKNLSTSERKDENELIENNI